MNHFPINYVRRFVLEMSSPALRPPGIGVCQSLNRLTDGSHRELVAKLPQ